MASLAVLFLLVSAALTSNAAAVRVGLTRIHSNPDVTATEFVRNALRRDMHRHARFTQELASSGGSTVAAPTRKDLPNGGEYLMTLAIGTPPLSY